MKLDGASNLYFRIILLDFVSVVLGSGLAMTHFFLQASIDEKYVIARPDPILFSLVKNHKDRYLDI